MGLKQLPKCKRKDCEYNKNGRCDVLNSSKFKCECPFFKKREDKQ